MNLNETSFILYCEGCKTQYPNMACLEEYIDLEIGEGEHLRCNICSKCETETSPKPCEWISSEPLIDRTVNPNQLSLFT